MTSDHQPMMGSTTFDAHNFQFSRSNEGLALPDRRIYLWGWTT